MGPKDRFAMVILMMVLSATIIIFEINGIIERGWRFWSSVWLLYGGVLFVGPAVYTYHSLRGGGVVLPIVRS